MNMTVIKTDWDERLVDVDSVIVVETDYNIQLEESYGTSLYLAGGSIISISQEYSDVVAALFGVEYLDEEPNEDIESELADFVKMIRDDYDCDLDTREHKEGYGGICRCCHAAALLKKKDLILERKDEE